MTKKIYSKFDKANMGNLPRVTFEGRIITISSVSEAKKAVDYLLSQDILGVDTETRPAFKKGIRHKVALLQVSTRDTCFLFRLNRLGMTDDIRRFLEDNDVPKIGLSWHDDLIGLHKIGNFNAGLFIDLQGEVAKLGIEDLSLQKMYANVFGKKISKAQRLSNWELENLSDSQKQYAATDAWACISLYEEFQRLLQTGDYEFVKVDEDTEEKKEAKEITENIENVQASIS